MIASDETPSINVYKLLLKIWVQSRRSDAPKICESIFKTIVSYSLRSTTTSKKRPKIDLEVFLLLLESWTMTPLPQSALKAQEVLETMKEANVTPNGKVDSLVMYSWLKASYKNESESNDTISRLIDKIEYLHNLSLSNGFYPDESMYRTIFQAYSRDKSNYSIIKMDNLLQSILELSVKKNKESIQLVNYFNSLVHPTVYSLIVSTWSSNPVVRAKELIEDMKRRGFVGRQLFMYYNLLFAAISRDNSSNYLEEAEQLFCNLSRIHLDNRIESVGIDITSTNYLLTAIVSNIDQIDGGVKQINKTINKCLKFIQISEESLQSSINDYTFRIMLNLQSKKIDTEVD